MSTFSFYPVPFCNTYCHCFGALLFFLGGVEVNGIGSFVPVACSGWFPFLFLFLFLFYFFFCFCSLCFLLLFIFFVRQRKPTSANNIYSPGSQRQANLEENNRQFFDKCNKDGAKQ